MKKLAACLLVLLCVLSPAAYALSAASWALYDPLTGRVLESTEAGVRRGMASTTKLMTALVACERYELDRVVEIDVAWCGVEGSSMYLRAGESLCVRELLYGLLLCSGNDAALALASLDGDYAGFVARMNERAAELGMADTSFENPSGLDGERHFSTAHDLCLLAQAVLAQPELRAIVGTRTAEVAGRFMQNHNKLLAHDGVIGLKTGYTRACGRCLVSAMERDGRTLIAVTLAAPDDWNDHLSLYARSFDGLERTELLAAGTCASVPVAGMGPCALYVDEDFALALTPAERAEVRVSFHGPRLCYAGFAAGERWGTARICLGGVVVFETEVYFSKGFAQPEVGFGARIRNWLSRLG